MRPPDRSRQRRTPHTPSRLTRPGTILRHIARTARARAWARGVGAWLPGEHGDGAVEPIEQLEPGGQRVHCEAADKSVALAKRPAGHGSGADAPSLQ